jgi:hypothetical protein
MGDGPEAVGLDKNIAGAGLIKALAKMFLKQHGQAGPERPPVPAHGVEAVSEVGAVFRHSAFPPVFKDDNKSIARKFLQKELRGRFLLIFVAFYFSIWSPRHFLAAGCSVESLFFRF